MPESWYVEHGGKEHGPYSASELTIVARDGQITPATLVRTDHRAWFPAGQIQGLRFGSPVLPSADGVSNSTGNGQENGDNSDGLSRSALIVLCSIAALFVAGCVVFVINYRAIAQRKEQQVAVESVAAAKEAASAWLANPTLSEADAVERQLEDSLSSPLVDDRVASSMLAQLRATKSDLAAETRAKELAIEAERGFEEAKDHIARLDVPAAIAKLDAYLKSEHSLNKSEARNLLDESQLAISKDENFRIAMSMSDTDFKSWEQGETFEDDSIRDPSLIKVREAEMRALLPRVRDARDKRSLAAQRQGEEAELARLKEEERIATVERERKEAELKSKDEERVRTEALRKKEVAENRRKREGEAKLAFDYDKSEFAKKGFEKELFAFKTQSDGDEAVIRFFGEEAIERTGKCVNGALALQEISKLYLKDRMTEGELRKVLEKPIPLKNSDEIKYTRIMAIEEFVSEYGLMQAGDARVSFKWLWEETKLRLRGE